MVEIKVMSSREVTGSGSHFVPMVAGYVQGPTAKRLGRGIVAVYYFGVEDYKRHKVEDLARPEIMDVKTFQERWPSLYVALFAKR